jgi:hypothetical protein
MTGKLSSLKAALALRLPLAPLESATKTRLSATLKACRVL